MVTLSSHVCPLTNPFFNPTNIDNNFKKKDYRKKNGFWVPPKLSDTNHESDTRLYHTRTKYGTDRTASYGFQLTHRPKLPCTQWRKEAVLLFKEAILGCTEPRKNFARLCMKIFPTTHKAHLLVSSTV